MDAQLRQEIVDLCTAMLATFSKEYIKAYTIELVKKATKEARETPSPYFLEKRPKDFDKSDIFKGSLIKLGAVRKNWLKRHFVVRYDYSVDYFVDENETTKKGTINLCGYRVEDDPNQSAITRIFNLAEKLGVDTSSIPKPKELPPFTIELYHYSRRCYYIQCANEDEFKEWVEMFRICCRRAYGLKNRDPCHQGAFHVAVRNTRWSLGRYGYWSYGGNEIQILSDLISTEVEYDILGRALRKLPNVPWFIRNFLRNKMMNVIDGIITSAVNPSWAAMDKTVTELRPTVEPRIKNQVDPIAQAQGNIVNKMKEQIMSAAQQSIEQHLAPHLAKIVRTTKEPIQSGFVESFKIWNDKTNGYSGNGSKESFSEYRRYPNNCWTMHPARIQIHDLEDPLRDLSKIFSDIWPSSIIYSIKEDITAMAYDGTYTFEKTVTEDQQDIESSKNSTREKYEHDVYTGTDEQIKFVIRSCACPVLFKVLKPITKPILSSLSSLVPSGLNDFLDVDEMYTQLINDIVDENTQIALDQIKN
ncbi:hypothetical protein DICPUDRAFT_40919 [Dictyostelium purpureum]|uniref:PH domain-containing protein n=1 Tax=Dictyostelium purpureum TaxID=5786 RepID=F0ZZ28_DICPU|nr:uncharacterized protein DICPUDRAFT_40919 [Dictyostelium purpureum]EGC30802.1 hypothetical protein DICPUDRAFT_40919 [Dictyostelium purpureum]|eukprot:XP_003292669.1 hypothetical protein DICPUDRAFT_40919 [Dictyostelium purpureum]